MLDKFLSYINEENLFNLNDKLLIAVSGGIDSMVLTDLIKRGGFEFGIAHINHHLRGEESDQEEKFIKAYCSQNTIDYFVHHIDPRIFEQGNMHAIAREERYNFLKTVKQNHNYKYILTAHHLGDNVETFIINLLRGAGINGLSGIKPKLNDLRRPMLVFNRDEIVKYRVENDIYYKEDSSNASDKYLRNKIRHQLIPAFSELSVNAEESINKSIGNLSNEQALLSELLGNIMKDVVTIHPNHISIALSLLDTFKQAKTLLYKLIEPYGFGFDVACNMIEDRSQASKFHSTSHEALIDRGILMIRKLGDKDTIFHSFKIQSIPFTISLYSRKYRFELVDELPIDFIKSKDLYIDINKLDDSLIIRNWKEGDRFAPIGMNGKTKKIKDYFIDKKINQWEKDETLLLESNGHIVAILDHTITDRVKITKKGGNNSTLKISTVD